MLWDMWQQRQINDNSASIRRMEEQSKFDDETLETRLRRTADRLDALMVACQAMWEILREEHGIGEDKLLAKIEEVDLRSGERDGKMARSAAKCGDCGRPNNAQRHKLCLYCGEPLNVSGDERHVFNR